MKTLWDDALNSSIPEPGTGAFIKYHLMCLPDLLSSL